MSDNPFTVRDLDNVNTKESPVKPVEEILYIIKEIHKDIHILKTDMLFIKSRIKEIKIEEDNISKGWGLGWY